MGWPTIIMAITTKLLSCFIFSRIQRRASAFQDNLTRDGRRRRYSHILRCTLQQATVSLFQFMFSSGKDQALITLTGFDHSAFRYLLGPFEKYYKLYTPYNDDGTVRILCSRNCDIPRNVSASKCLGLFLTWNRAREKMMTLSLAFGVTASLPSLFRRFARKLV